jgi:orotate phosphoribosyltransferase
MTREQLAKEIYKISYLRGNFKLRSGQISNEYFDKYRFESNPILLKEIAKQLAALLPKNCDALAGLEMGGIPIATALSLETGLPCVFIRKQAKDYGTCQFAEGLDIKNKNLCLIEDVITTGGQVILSAQLTNSGLNLKALFNMDELKSQA